jgi:hypothetical protein
MRRYLQACLLVLFTTGLRPYASPARVSWGGASHRPSLVHADTDRYAFHLDKIIDHGDNSFTRICKFAQDVPVGSKGNTVDGFVLDQVFDEDGNLFTNDKTLVFHNFALGTEAPLTFKLHNDNDYNDNGFIWHFTDPDTPTTWIEEKNDFEQGYIVNVN